MADRNFVVHNGLTVGPLTIDAATGDIQTSGNLTLSGGGSIEVSNVAVSAITQNDSSISINDTGSGSSIVMVIDGLTEHTVDEDGVNLATGDRYAIAGTSVLDATTLGTGIVNSSLTTVGNLTALSVAGDLDVYGNLTVQGIAVLNSGSSGTITLGDEATDQVSFSADVSSDILPSTTDLDLGASGTRWGNVYSVTVNTSANVDVGGDLNITGTGYVGAAVIATTDDATALSIALG